MSMPCWAPVFTELSCVQGSGVLWAVWAQSQRVCRSLRPGSATGTWRSKVGHVICCDDYVISCDCHLQVRGEKGSGTQKM